MMLVTCDYTLGKNVYKVSNCDLVEKTGVKNNC